MIYSSVWCMTPTLNEYTEKDGYYIQTLLPEVGYVTYKVTPQTGEFITEPGYSDSEDLPWGLINPLRQLKRFTLKGLGLNMKVSLPKALAKFSSRTLWGWGWRTDFISRRCSQCSLWRCDPSKTEINSEASEQNINHLLDLIGENIELASPNGSDWEITEESIPSEPQVKLIRDFIKFVVSDCLVEKWPCHSFHWSFDNFSRVYFLPMWVFTILPLYLHRRVVVNREYKFDEVSVTFLIIDTSRLSLVLGL